MGKSTVPGKSEYQLRMAEAMAHAGKRVLIVRARGNFIVEKVGENTIRVQPQPAPPEPTVWVDECTDG